MAVQEAPPNVKPEEQWPAVALAYDLGVKSSYEVMLKRFEIVEGRIRALVTMTASLTIGAPVFISTMRNGASYTSWLLCGALIVALAILAAGAASWTTGSLRLMDPALLASDDAARLSVFDFQRAALKNAADAFAVNARRLERKIRFADGITYALMAEIVLMVGWALTGL